MKNSEKLKKLIEKLPIKHINEVDVNIAFYASCSSMYIHIPNGYFPSIKLKDFDEIRLYFEKTPHAVILDKQGLRGSIAYRILKE